jgi:hypothetical protein
VHYVCHCCHAGGSFGRERLAAGAAGNLAAEAVARADADGHTLLTVATAFAVNATL